MNALSSPVFEFGDFQLDPSKRLLRKAGTMVPLTSRVFETLLFLVEHHGTVLDKERLMAAIWPDSIVEENNLTQNIHTLRRLFGETPGSNRFIVTIPGRGYRFVADVHTRDRSVLPSEGSKPAAPDKSEQPAALTELKSQAQPAVREAQKTFHPRAIFLLCLGLLLGALILFLAIRKSPPPTNQPATSAPLSAPVEGKSIAVLPFENLSTDPENAYFTAGVQEEILSNLAKIADLKVISRTSVSLYASGAVRNAKEIGRQLGVAHLVEGSVQRSNNHLRIHAQLIDTRTDLHLWAQTYDRDLADVFAIQSEIAQAIAIQLNAKISEHERARITSPVTSDLIANDFYQQALAIESQLPRPQNLIRAVELVERAIARDQRFLMAYCTLARMHLTFTNMGYDHAGRHRELAEAAIQKAAALQPDAGEVHLVRGWYLGMEVRDYDRARAELELARRTLPNNAILYFQTAYIDRRQGRWNEAARNLDRAAELDPKNPIILIEVANTLEELGRYDEAAAFGRRALANSRPDDYYIRFFDANLRLQQWGDLRPLREQLNTMLRDGTDDLTAIASTLLFCAVLERDAEAADRALAALPPGDVGLGPGLAGPREWLIGGVARIFNRPEIARPAFETTRAAMEERVRTEPDNASAWSLLGLAEAALGRKEEAIKAGRRACEILPLSKEALSGIRVARQLAKIYAWVGEKDAALQELAKLAGRPGAFDYGELKLHPDWDSLRGDPRFDKLISSVAPKGTPPNDATTTP